MIYQTYIPNIQRSEERLLHRMYKHGKILGTAIDSGKLDANVRFITRNYRILTPEVEMKIDRVRPAPDVWDFNGADRICQFALDHGMTVNGHCLRWNLYLPDWILALDAVSQKAVIQEFIQVSLNHYQVDYPGIVTAFDIVNEGYNRYGNPHGDTWDKCGASIPLCYQWARQTSYQGKLYYNDFNWDQPWQDAIMRELVEPGLIDGIGWQMHLGEYTWPAHLPDYMLKLEQAGIDIRITEADVCNDHQADTWASLGELILLQPIEALITWGMTHRANWRYGPESCNAPLLFNSDYSPAEGYYRLMEVFR